MRVEAVAALPKLTESATPSAEPSTTLAIKNFQAAMASDDSLVALLEPLRSPVAERATAPYSCAADALLAFKQPDFAAQRSFYFLLLQKLVDLLGAAGSKETLEAKLWLMETGDAGLRAVALCVRMSAQGDSPEQALLRWGLGLAHLQQALLFTSRQLRQQLKQNGN